MLQLIATPKTITMSNLELVPKTIQPERKPALKASIDTPNQQEEARRIAEKIVGMIPGSAYMVITIQIEQIYEFNNTNEENKYIINRINALIAEIEKQLKDIINMKYLHRKENTMHFLSSTHSLELKLEYNRNECMGKRANQCSIHGIIDIEPMIDSSTSIDMECSLSTLEPGFIRKKARDLLSKE